MKKLCLFGRNAKTLQPLLESYQFVEESVTPDLVVSYGGDGTLLHAERSYPDIPKVMLRDSKICKKCTNLSPEEVFAKIKQGQYTVNKVRKLVVEHRGVTDWALNDVILSHESPIAAIRYTVTINGIPYKDGREIVGDGVVFATPFGSGAYYRSIADGVFSEGIGVAFNNTTEQVDHIVLKTTDRVECTITRGRALFAVDAQELLPLDINDVVVVRASDTAATILTFGQEFTYWAH